MENQPPELPHHPQGGVSRRGLLTAAAVGAAGLAIMPWLQGCAASGQQSPKTSDAAPPGATGSVPVTLQVNGQWHSMKLDSRVTLLDALREELDLVGTKKGCDHGQCGACTVLVNDRRVNSCLLLAVAAQGKSITTIEGLAKGDQLHPMQEAFIEKDAFQCGYCTPGQICSAVGLMKEGHATSEAEIREEMSGNICRCGAYPNIVAAVRRARQKKV